MLYRTCTVNCSNFQFCDTTELRAMYAVRTVSASVSAKPPKWSSHTLPDGAKPPYTSLPLLFLPFSRPTGVLDRAPDTQIHTLLRIPHHAQTDLEEAILLHISDQMSKAACFIYSTTYSRFYCAVYFLWSGPLPGSYYVFLRSSHRPT